MMVDACKNDKFKMSNHKKSTLFSHTIYIQVSTVQCIVVEMAARAAKGRPLS